MPAIDPRIDAYIARAEPFARPILSHLRALVHEACPPVEETIKWSAPFFLHHGLLCQMAAFKRHCAFGFWKGARIVGEDAAADAMGQFGRIGTLADLPPAATIVGYVRKAAALNEAGAPRPARGPRAPKPEAIVPDDLAAALKTNAKARRTFEAFSPSHRREYVEWIVEARREATHASRLATTLEWLAEGKPRNWRYVR